MSYIPRWVQDEIDRVREHRLPVLNLTAFYGERSKTPLTHIPLEIYEMTWLKELNLRSHRLETIPDQLAQLSQLERLYLPGVYREIPQELGQLRGLTQLTLDGLYSAIPQELGQLQGLTQLTLDGLYSAIPQELGQLRSLAQLTLSGKLSAFPMPVLGLSALEHLDLMNTSIREIPSDILQLQKLKYLEVNPNTIEYPPPEIVKAEKFRSANVEGIFNFFRALQAEAEDQLYEAKLLIVGEPGAGKTTLARKLEDDTAAMPEEAETTRGIDVSEWSFPLEDGRDFRVNIWDFGGHEIYHATHQFFLTKRSLYVLVADMRREDTDFHYWLDVVRTRGGDSPIIVVKNKREGRVRQIGEPQLRERFANLQKFYELDLSTDDLDRLKSDIRHCLRQLPHIGDRLPKSWVDVRKSLETNPRNYIKYSDYLVICHRLGLTDQQQIDQILGYLHDLGVCLHFARDPLLREFVILKPEWGTAAVYAVLDNTAINANFGRFTLDDLVNVWTSHIYDGMHNQLLRLMVNFKLCYQIPNTDTYIAPQLLDENKPQYEWNNQDNLTLRYAYEFMPKGIVSRLIVAMNEHIHDNLVWKTGVVLARGSAYAEVMENYKGNEITIKVRGVDKEQFLFIIAYELERLNGLFQNLDVQKEVPCNCPKCRDTGDPHYFSFNFLERLYRAGKPAICQISLVDVDPHVLLRGVALATTVDEMTMERLLKSKMRFANGSPFVYIENLHTRDARIAKEFGDTVMNDNSEHTEIKIDGNVNNSQITGKQEVHGNYTINYGNLNNAEAGSARAEIKQLLQQLEEALNAVPAGQAEAAAEVKEYADEVAELAGQDAPRKVRLKITGDSLKEAAQNLLAVTPIAVKIAKKLLLLA